MYKESHIRVAVNPLFPNTCGVNTNTYSILYINPDILSTPFYQVTMITRVF